MKPMPGQESDGSPTKKFQLGHLFDECFLYDADWKGGSPPYRETIKWTEPAVQRHLPAEPPSGIGEAACNAERDRYQRDRIAHMDSNPIVAAVYEARSTVLSIFTDQFITLAENGGSVSANQSEFGHVTDVGLVFRGKAGDFTNFAKGLTVSKADNGGPGQVDLLNPEPSWFVQSDPIFEKTKDATIDTGGVKLDWRLRMPWFDREEKEQFSDPEHFLHHYEIVSELDGVPRWDKPMLVKPTATLGGLNKDGFTKSLRPDWQFVDDLADLSDDQRKAMLPTTGEEDALRAAITWVKIFHQTLKVTLTYSVTPVDIAGTKGTERAFVVDVLRPQPPIRAAEAELRIFVRKGSETDPYPSWSSRTDAPGNLGVVLALRDKAASADENGTGDIRISRQYKLIVDPDDIVPAGNYGTDGLTSRLRGQQTAAAQQHADEIPFPFDRERFNDCRYKDASAIEPEPDARKSFDYWLRFAGEPVPNHETPQAILTDPTPFFSALWRRAKGGRVACRFSLQTLMVVTEPGGEPHIFESRRVPVDIEIIMDNATDNENHGPVIMRPEAFEWPVRLDLPPLGPGQVRARAGFARFRAPADRATLNDFIHGTNDALMNVRDPERRILTMVEWDAVPDWAAPATEGADAPNAMHAATICGFDLHELDIDELAPLDTASGSIGRPLPFAQDATLWRRARRVARIQQLPASTAMLVPYANDDLLGWQAHYPSETWRLDRAEQRSVGANDHSPIYRSWWTAAETTPRFPDKILRRRLIPLPDENVVSALFAAGKPKRVYVRLETAQGSEVQKAFDGNSIPMPPVDLLNSFKVGEVEFAKFFRIEDAKKDDSGTDWTGWKKISLSSLVDDEAFSPSLLRAMMLCLIWQPDAKIDSVYNGHAGLTLSIVGETNITKCDYTGASEAKAEKRVPTGNADIPLVFSAPFHPVIEETIAELALAVRDKDKIYRRYTPVVQPVLRPDVKDLSGFLSATAAAKDPYGWGVLQSLGLAATIRLFDGDSDSFVEPKALLKWVNKVLGAVVERYRNLHVNSDALGAPFVEILLRPGKDRVPGPFDAMLERTVESNFEIDSNALAVVQISLRPVPLQAFRYRLLEMGWKRGLRPKPKEGDSFELGMQFAFTPSDQAQIDILRLVDHRLIELKKVDAHKNGETSYLVPIHQPTRGTTTFDSELSLLVRWPVGTSVDPETQIKVQVVTRTRSLVDVVSADGSVLARIVDSDAASPSIVLTEFLNVEGFEATQPGSTGATHPPRGWIGSESFEQFAPQDAKAWAGAFLDKNNPASEAFAAFRRQVSAAFPKLEWPATNQGYEAALASFPDWAQRFLDYGTGPDGAPRTSVEEKFPPVPTVSFALAAPSKATPWRLAAAPDGTQSLSFLHSDRWGHVRAYALRPFGRYQEMMIGAGAYTDPEVPSGREQAEALIDPGSLLPNDDVWKLLGFEVHKIPTGLAPPATKLPLGYGVAVSPRTERVEPPLILSSGNIAPNKEWQLVVAQHGEESFAFSNRPLFARLGWEGVSLSFVRDYSEPNWPARLAAVTGGDGKAEPELHPLKPPPQEWKRPPSAAPAIGRSEFAHIAKQFPNLWKGADIYRIPKLPHYYRSTVLATARAGVIVSPITTVTQEVFPTEKPDLVAAADSDGQSYGSSLVYLTTKDGSNPTSNGTFLQVSLPLVAHYDLMDQDTRRIWADDLPQSNPTLNIAWWPDPNVVYTLFQRTERTAGSAVEDELAEIRLVARPDGTSTASVFPIVVRARGTRFDTAIADPLVTQRTIDTKRRRFRLDVFLSLKPGRSPLASGQVPTDIKPEEITAFNQTARRSPFTIPEPPAEQYAEIVSRHALTLTIKPKSGETALEFLSRLKILAKSLVDLAATIGLGLPGNAEPLSAEGHRLQKWIDSNPSPTSIEGILTGAKLPHRIRIWWPHGIEFKPPADGMQDCEIALDGIGDADFPPLLMVLAIPSDADFETLNRSVNLQTGGAKKAVGLLAILARDVVTGGDGTLFIRAKHGRGGVSDDYKISWPSFGGLTP
jgi:hypothetical protein